jgi:hypothetical protein
LCLCVWLIDSDNFFLQQLTTLLYLYILERNRPPTDRIRSESEQKRYRQDKEAAEMSITCGNKVEFQLSGKSAASRKRTTNALLVTSDADNDEDEHAGREMVSSVTGNKILSLAPTATVAAPLVIPLLPPKHMTEDELAAKRIVDELRVGAGGDGSGEDCLVIAQQNEVKAKAPLLLASQDPQLIGIADETERFKFDISSRADDVDFRSDIYRNIPIEKFGEAMLRGMGWDGVSKEEKETADKLYKQVVARDDRLGLGAMPRPPDESTRGSKESKKKLKEEWKNKVCYTYREYLSLP